jgi:hypothetical protein
MADEKNGGSDLDIFEGLGKKTTTSAAPAPPPPPSMAPVPVDGKRTLLGIPNPSAASTTLPAGPPPPPPPVSAAPPPPPPVSAAPPPPPASAAPATKQTPPPPPGRGSLPNISKSGPPPLPGGAPAQTAPAPSTAPQNGASGKLEMDWDDEDEATHVFDKDKQHDSQPNMAAAPATLPNTARGTGGPPPPPSGMQPAAGKSAPPPIPKAGSVPPAPATATGLGALMAQPPTAQTLSGHAPPPPPPASGRVPVSAAPPPAPTDRLPGVSQPPPPPPPPGSMRAPMSVPSAPPPLNNTLASAPSVTPPPPPQVTTQPMPMPPKAQSVPPPAAPVQAVVSAPPPQISPRSMEQTALVRPAPQSRGWVGIGLGLLAVAIAAGAVVFFLIPRTGTITVNVNDAKGASVDRVDVFVDGKKECETTPCTFKRDNGGHSVKVVAQGFETPEPKQVTVETGKDVPVAFVLSKGGSGGTGVRVGSATSGLKLYIDGELVGNLPQDVKDLAPGDHKIKVTGGERYANLEKTITVAKGEMLDLSNVALKVVHGKATIDSTSPGAKVYIVSGSDRRELPRLPLSVELDTSRSWTLEASKFGYNDFRQPIVFEDGQAEKTFTIAMDLKGAAPAPGPAPGPGPGPVVTPPTTASAATTTPTPKPTADAPSGQATLNINSIPASNVVLDGRPIGQTPKMGFSVSPGAHTVKFINNDQGLSKTVSVSVKAGETKTVAAKLRD